MFIHKAGCVCVSVTECLFFEIQIFKIIKKNNFISVSATSAKKMTGNCWWTDKHQHNNMPFPLRKGFNEYAKSKITKAILHVGHQFQVWN